MRNTEVEESSTHYEVNQKEESHEGKEVDYGSIIAVLEVFDILLQRCESLIKLNCCLKNRLTSCLSSYPLIDPDFIIIELCPCEIDHLMSIFLFPWFLL